MTYNPNFLVRDYDGAATYTLSFAAGNNSNRLVSGVIFNKKKKGLVRINGLGLPFPKQDFDKGDSRIYTISLSERL